MSFKEVLFFRVPQFIQTHVKGRYQLNYKPKTLTLNKDFIPLEYKIKNLKTLFNKYPFSSLFHIFTEFIDVFDFNNWRKDLNSGITSPINYYCNIKRQDFKTNGDVKFIAEVSRMEFLPYLAFKFVECKDEKYGKRIKQIVIDWNKQNPYLRSIHWTSGIEVGIRSVNLIYAHGILRQFKMLTERLDFAIRTQINYNYQYIKNHLSLYSSANNHLMAELMGLNVISSYFEVKENEARRWKQMLFQQIDIQVNNDGVHMELCTRYHAEVTDQVLIGISFLKQAGQTIPKDVSEKLKQLFSFTEHVDYYGIETIFGDNDEGFVVNPYFDTSFSLYKSQLASSNYLFSTNYKSDGKIDFRNYLIFGSNFKSSTIAKQEADILFENSGYCFMYDHNTETKLSFDCGTIGDDISAAHGHSDIFHFNLSVYGVPFIVDSGTYQYHSKDEFWRNYFRSAQAHNTISINGNNHAKNNGRMSWLNYPKVKVNDYRLSKNESYIKATTNAFIQEGIEHSRAITFNKNTKRIQITDILTALDINTKRVSFILHFHPDVVVELKKETIEVTNKGIKLLIRNKYFVSSKLIYGDVNRPLGWFSSSFNKKQKTKSLILNFETTKNSKIETIYIYE